MQTSNIKDPTYLYHSPILVIANGVDPRRGTIIQGNILSVFGRTPFPSRTHSTAKNVVPPRASQFIRPDLSSFLCPCPSSVEFAYEAPTEPDANGEENEAETAAVFCSFVVCSVTSRHELASTVLCKRAPSKVEQLKMVPVDT